MLHASPSQYRTDDTIVAIATPAVGSPRGIVRLSGPRALECLAANFRADDSKALSNVVSATAIAGQVTLTALSRSLPCDAYVWPNERSYTRQPIVELHLLGSPPLLEILVEQLCASGARLAGPGEFTLRAFLAGRLDLTQAEAVLGLIDANNDRDFRTALHQLAAGLGGRLQALRSELLDVLEEVEAGLDFADEDLDLISADALRARLTNAAQQVDELNDRLSSRGASNRLPRVALVGRPNVGKSSLFNALVEQRQSLVSDAAGTTRDYLTGRLKLGDLEVELVDTAGLDQYTPHDEIDAAAQQLARQQHEQADVTLRCLDSTQPHTDALLNSDEISSARQLTIWTKSDLATQLPPTGTLAVSSRTGTGLDELKTRLRMLLATSDNADTQVVAATAIRARSSLAAASEALQQAIALLEAHSGDELLAAELRLALASLGEVVGAIYTDDLLDRIFSRFCIGK